MCGVTHQECILQGLAVRLDNKRPGMMPFSLRPVNPRCLEGDNPLRASASQTRLVGIVDFLSEGLAVHHCDVIQSVVKERERDLETCHDCLTGRFTSLSQGCST